MVTGNIYGSFQFSSPPISLTLDNLFFFFRQFRNFVRTLLFRHYHVFDTKKLVQSGLLYKESRQPTKSNLAHSKFIIP